MESAIVKTATVGITASFLHARIIAVIKDIAIKDFATVKADMMDLIALRRLVRIIAQTTVTALRRIPVFALLAGKGKIVLLDPAKTNALEKDFARELII